MAYSAVKICFDCLQNNLAEVKHLKKILAEEEVLVKIRYLLFP